MIADIIEILFFIHGIVFLSLNIHFLNKGKKNAILYIYPFLFVFNVLPKMIHILFGIPDYSFWVAMEEAASDPVSNMIYETVILVVSFAMWIPFLIYEKKDKQSYETVRRHCDNKIADYALLLQLLPLCFTIIIPSYWGNYLAYGARYTIPGIKEIPGYILSLSTLGAGLYWLNTDCKNKKKNILSLLLLLLALYLRGSRAIIMTSFVLLIYALLFSNKLNFKKTFPFFAIAIVASIGLLYLYHLHFRTTAQNFYTYYSIDLSRDYTVIYSIYAQLNQIEILQYPLQGIIFNFLFWLPRAIAPWKPYPFSSYMSAALLGNKSSDVPYLGVRTTTNLLSQAICDCGIFIGCILSATFCSLYCMLVDKIKNINLKYIFIYIGFEILVQDFAYWGIEISLFIIYWGGVYLIDKKGSIFYKGFKGKSNEINETEIILLDTIKSDEANVHAGTKARDDINFILSRYQKEYFYKGKTHVGWVLHYLKTAIKLYDSNIICIVHYPYYLNPYLENKIKKWLPKRSVLIIHDIISLRENSNDAAIHNEMDLINAYSCVISHNQKMTNWLKEHGCKANIINLELFDYIRENDIQKPVFGNRNNTVAFAGNLDKKKSGFIYENINFDLDVYGVNFAENDGNVNVHYCGIVQAEKLPSVLHEDFGLVWDGKSIDTCDGSFGNYLRYNDPHKTSLYIASGRPVIIWENAALADFIRMHNVGFTVSSLSEISDKISLISDAEYYEMSNNAFELSQKINNGYFINKAIEEALKYISDC